MLWDRASDLLAPNVDVDSHEHSIPRGLIGQTKMRQINPV